MKSFTDNAGRIWTVAVNVAAIKRVRAICDVDLNAIVILRSLSQPEQRYIGSTADLKSRLAIRSFFLLAKISGVQRSGRRMTGNLSSIALAEEEALATEG